MQYIRIGLLIFLIACTVYVLWHALVKPWLASLDEPDEMQELRDELNAEVDRHRHR